MSLRYPAAIGNDYTTAIQFFNTKGIEITIASETDISTTMSHSYQESDSSLSRKIFDSLTGGNTVNDLGESGKGFVQDIGNLFSGGGLSSLEGVVVNPRPWMIYERTDFRKFSFQFNFYPTSQYDANMVVQICDQFQRLSLPEPKGDSNHRLKTPPLWKKIKFLKNTTAAEVTNIGPCALVSVSVTHGGNSLHDDGREVHTGLSLEFQEIQSLDTNVYDSLKG